MSSLEPQVERRLFRGTSTPNAGRGSIRSESISGTILARARLDPERPALESEERSLSYGELETEASRLAAALAAAGVRRGARVGLLLDHSVDAVLGAIGIMLAGAACVPLDAAGSPERLAQTIALTGCTIAVGRAGGDAGSAAGLTIVDPAAPFDDPGPALPPIEADDTAFVIPTAANAETLVALSHGDVLALLGATKTLFNFSGDERWAFFHSGICDVAVWEVAACLSSGGTGVVVPAAVLRDGAAVSDFLERQRISIVHQTPSGFRAIAAAQNKAGRPWPALRWIVFTGEPIDRMALRRFRAANAVHGADAGRVRLVNMYGATEATIFSTFKLLEEPELAGEVASPLGRPLAHQEIVLCDESGAPVADGTPGEIWIRGSGVVAGYVGEAALSAQRFVRRSTPDGPARFFKTGDLARRRPNGELEYVGHISTPQTLA